MEGLDIQIHIRLDWKMAFVHFSTCPVPIEQWSLGEGWLQIDSAHFRVITHTTAKQYLTFNMYESTQKAESQYL